MSRGMSLVEIMIAMLLASVISAFILMITRTQLIAYEQNDQVTRMQQNERAGVAYVETMMRRACGGIAHGSVNVYLPSKTAAVDCLTVYDGAQWNAGSFSNNQPSQLPDAVEIIYGTTPFTAVTNAAVIGATAPQLDVASKLGFKVGDNVLYSNYNHAVLLQIASITDGATLPQATFTFGNVAAVVSPDAAGADPITDSPPPPGVPSNVLMKAAVSSLYVEDGTHRPEYKDMLMLDPEGVLSSAHANAQPLVDNFVDLQVAIGADDNGNGAIDSTSEWRGDVSGELPLAVGPWNEGSNLQPRWLRFSFVFRTSNVYPGKAPALGPFEDRTTYPSTTGTAPRYRPVRVTVAPRVWNLVN